MTTTDDPKSVLTKDEAQAAVEPILEGMLKWYWLETDKWEWWAWRLQTGVLVMSFLVTVAAALPPLPPYQKVRRSLACTNIIENVMGTVRT